MSRSPTSRYRDLLRVERPVADDSLNGAGSGSWLLVCEVWAELEDILPSRGEKVADGINVASRPARVGMRYREDIPASMRFVKGATVDGDEVDYSSARIMQIVAGPAKKLSTNEVEFVVEDYSTAGNPA